MYIVVKNGTNVTWGPKYWDKHDLQNHLYAKHNIEYPLPYLNPSEKIINVSDEVSIWPVIFRNDPQRNMRTQRLDGPFYEFSETHAHQYHTVVDRTLSEIQVYAREVASSYRRILEDHGFFYTIGEEEYKIDCSKEKRTNFFNGSPGNWILKKKVEVFSPIEEKNVTDLVNSWVYIDQATLDDICNTIKEKVQMAFEKEKKWYDDIDSFSTIEDAQNYVETGLEDVVST